MTVQLFMALVTIPRPAVIADNTSLLVPVGAVLVAAVSGYAGWKAVQRTKSGKIDTTEAAELWKEATGMRTALRDEVQALQAEIRMLKDEELSLRQENQALRAENAVWRKRVEALEATVAELHARISQLEQPNG